MHVNCSLDSYSSTKTLASPKSTEGGVGVAIRDVGVGFQMFSILVGPGDAHTVLGVQVCDQAGHPG